MTCSQMVSKWLARGRGCATAVGSWTALEGLAETLSAAGVAVCRLGSEIVQRIPDPDSFLVPGDPLAREGREAARQAVAQAFEAWLEEAGAGHEPLAIRDLELAVAERLELARLAELGRPVLLLAPGRTAGATVRLFATGPHDGLPLPPAVAADGATWTLEADSDESPPEHVGGGRERG